MSYTLEQFKKLTFQQVIDICHQRSVAGGWWNDMQKQVSQWCATKAKCFV